MDTANPTRGPLLPVSGQEDRMVPDAATRAAYKLYGDSTPVAARMPEQGKLSDARLGYFIRAGKHSMTPDDWKVFMQFGDRWLK